MKPKPYTFPEIAADEIGLQNELVGQRREVAPKIAGQAFAVRFHAEPAKARFTTWWKIAARDAPLWIALDDFRVFAEIRQLIGNVAWEQLPEDVASVVLETVFEGLLKDLRKRLGFPLELVGPASEESADQADAGFGFTMQTEDGTAATGVVRFGRELTAAITQLAARLDAVPLFDPAELPIPMHVEIGRTVLTISELRKLQMFDVVLMDYTEFMEEGRVFVRCDSSLAFRGKVDQTQLVLQELITPEDESESLLASRVTDDLPCELRFELARLAVPLEQCAAIQPGHILNLPCRSSDRVAVVAGNVTLGSGEVVQVGDRLGVRLDSLDANLGTADLADAE